MKRVGILRGGEGKNYKKSIKEGGDLIVFIFENLAHRYTPVDIFIDQADVWHLGGLPILPGDLVHKVDVIWNVAHPSTISVIESFAIPQISQNPFYLALENNPNALHEHLKDIRVGMARYMLAPKSAREVHSKFGAPWIVKVGKEVEVVQTFNELTTIMNKVNNIIVEEFISGTPSAVHSIPNFRGEEIYVLPHNNLSAAEKEKAIKFAKELHKHLGAKHYLKADFTLHPKRGFFLTNLTGTPDLRPHSHLEHSLGQIGAKMQHLVEHIIESA